MARSVPNRDTPPVYRDLVLSGANILAFIFVAAYYILPQVPGFSRISFVAGCALTALAIIRGLQTGHLKLPRLWYAPWVFLIYCAVSLIWCTDLSRALNRLQQVSAAIIGATAIWTWVYNGMTWRPIVRAIFLGATVLSASMLPEVLSAGVGARAAGIAVNPNAAGLLLSLGAIVIWCAPIKLARWLPWVAVGFLIYAAAFTGSRKVLFVLACFLLIYAIDMPPARRRSATFVALLLAVAVGIGVCHDGEGARKMLGSLSIIERTELAVHGRDLSYLTRMEMYRTAIEMWKERPVQGWGLGQFASLTDFDTYAHSNYPQVLSNLGFIGFVLLYVFHASVAVRGARAFRRGVPLGSTILILLVMLLALDSGMVSFFYKGTWLTLIFLECLCTESERTMNLAARSR